MIRMKIYRFYVWWSIHIDQKSAYNVDIPLRFEHTVGEIRFAISWLLDLALKVIWILVMRENSDTCIARTHIINCKQCFEQSCMYQNRKHPLAYYYQIRQIIAIAWNEYGAMNVEFQSLFPYRRSLFYVSHPPGIARLLSGDADNSEKSIYCPKNPI